MDKNEIIDQNPFRSIVREIFRLKMNRTYFKLRIIYITM